MAYDINGNAFDPRDTGEDNVLKAAALVIGAVLLIAFVVWGTAQCAEEPEPVEEPATLTLELDNAKMMHLRGMPTAEDVMYFKLHHQWGYYDDEGTLRAYDELPGEEAIWYHLYNIDYEGDEV